MARPKRKLTPFDSYIICATPRTGSTLLCNLLGSTGVTGDPDSYFMTVVDPVWIERWGLPVPADIAKEGYCAAYLEAAIAAGKGQTGIFGLRLMQRNVADLSAMIERVYPGLLSDRARFHAAFGHVLYVHLARADTLAQAVSMVKAEQTGLWHIAADGTELERLSPPCEPEYDFDRISARLIELQQQDAGWLRWFDEQGVVPLKVTYEALSENPVQVVQQICGELGVPMPSPDASQPGVARLADAISLEWMNRYRADLASLAK